MIKRIIQALTGGAPREPNIFDIEDMTKTSDIVRGISAIDQGALPEEELEAAFLYELRRCENRPAVIDLLRSLSVEAQQPQRAGPVLDSETKPIPR